MNRPTGISCPDWRPLPSDPKARRCLHYNEGGRCSLPSRSLCVEWEKRQTAAGLPIVVADPLKASTVLSQTISQSQAALGLVKQPLGSPCAIEGCPGKSVSRALCYFHYKRLRRKGNAFLACERCGKERMGHNRVLCGPCRDEMLKLGLSIPTRRKIMGDEDRARSRGYMLRQAALDAYGRTCACCSEDHEVFLAIDHINEDGAAHRRVIKSGFYQWLRDNQYPSGFQTLCHNCNWAKSRGECPHTKMEFDTVMFGHHVNRRIALAARRTVCREIAREKKEGKPK